MSRERQEPEPEKHVLAKTRSEVLADIQRLEKAGEFDELGGYLIELSKWGEKPQQYENIFQGYLYSQGEYLREAAVFSLLYALKIRNEEYRARALEQLVKSDEDDFHDRQWPAASLAMAYQGTKDREILRAFFALLDDEAAYDIPKTCLVDDILQVWGVSSVRARIDARTGIGVELEVRLRAQISEFEAELAEARQFIAT
jgi:hypothetical protein